MDTKETCAMCFDDGNVDSEDESESEKQIHESSVDNVPTEDIDEEVNENDMNMEWTEDTFPYHTVEASFEDVAADLKINLREGVARLADRLRAVGLMQLFSSDSQCEELRNFTTFANIEFWQHLIQYLNKTRSTDIEAVDGYAMTKFI